MKWITGIRSDVLYTITRRPLDPRWSQQDLQVLLGYCANGQALGWQDDRAFNAAEAILIRQKNHGISWSNIELNKDMEILLNAAELC
jgi:hypothetical protein